MNVLNLLFIFVLLSINEVVEQKEFKILFDTYFEQVRRYIYYRSSDDDLSTEIAQKTFVKLWEKRKSVDSTKVKGLLFKIASDFFINDYRRKQIEFKFFKNYCIDIEDVSPEEQLKYKELEKAYETALKEMPEKQRIVFLMNRIDGKKYLEIAENLNLSVKAIEKRMSLALTFLRDRLKDKVTTIVLFFLIRAKNLMQTR